MIPIHHRGNSSGELSFLEGGHDIPFQMKRVYYIYNIEPGNRRGFHAHKKLEQCLICLNGSCKVLMDDGSEQKIVELCSPNEGLYVGPMAWQCSILHPMQYCLSWHRTIITKMIISETMKNSFVIRKGTRYESSVWQTG